MLLIKNYTNIKYFKKKKSITNKKFIIQKLTYKFLENELFFVKNKYFNDKFKIKLKIYQIFWVGTSVVLLLKKKTFIINFKSIIFFKKIFAKYVKLLNILNIECEKKKIIITEENFYNKIYKIQNLRQYFILYFKIFNWFFLDKFFLTKIKINTQNLFKFILIFNEKNKIFINIQNLKKNKNFSFISLGFFLKFFNNKKNLKKNKLLKLLIIKYIKKLFFYAKINKIIFICKNKPVMFSELLHIFFQEILITIKKKIQNKIINEKINVTTPKIFFYLFLYSKKYIITKIKKKGRIKRKITKKLIKKNKLID